MPGIYDVDNSFLPEEQSVTRGHHFKLKKVAVSSVVFAPSLNCFKNRLDKLWEPHMYVAIQIGLSISFCPFWFSADLDIFKECGLNKKE